MIDVCNILIKEKDGYRGRKMVWDTAEAKTVWQLRGGGPQAMRRQFDAKSKLTSALYLAYMYAGQRSLPRLLCHLQVLGLVPVNLCFVSCTCLRSGLRLRRSFQVRPSVCPSAGLVEPSRW